MKTELAHSHRGATASLDSAKALAAAAMYAAAALFAAAARNHTVAEEVQLR